MRDTMSYRNVTMWCCGVRVISSPDGNPRPTIVVASTIVYFDIIKSMFGRRANQNAIFFKSTDFEIIEHYVIQSSVSRILDTNSVVLIISTTASADYHILDDNIADILYYDPWCITSFY